MSSSTMMDIVVVPTISLNPKKAKKKLKKAARMHEDSEEPRLPVNDPLFGKENLPVMENSFSLEQRFSKASSPKVASTPVATTPKKAPLARPQAQPARAKAPEVATSLLSSHAAPALPLKSCAAEAKVVPDSTMKRSWFDITEEDDDTFLDSLERSPLQVVA